MTEEQFNDAAQSVMANTCLTKSEQVTEINKLMNLLLNAKSAMKGTNKNLNAITQHDYLTVINEQKTIYTCNRGFRLGFNDSKLHSYSCNKAGLIYDYIKVSVSFHETQRRI